MTKTFVRIAVFLAFFIFVGETAAWTKNLSTDFHPRADYVAEAVFWDSIIDCAVRTASIGQTVGHMNAEVGKVKQYSNSVAVESDKVIESWYVPDEHRKGWLDANCASVGWTIDWIEGICGLYQSNDGSVLSLESQTVQFNMDAFRNLLKEVEKSKKNALNVIMGPEFLIGFESGSGGVSWPCDSCPSPIPPPPCPPVPCLDCVGVHYRSVDGALEKQALNQFADWQEHAIFWDSEFEIAVESIQGMSDWEISPDWSGYVDKDEKSTTPQRACKGYPECGLKAGHAWWRLPDHVGYDVAAYDDGIVTGAAGGFGRYWGMTKPVSTPPVPIPIPFYGVEPVQWRDHVHASADADMAGIGAWRSEPYASTSFPATDASIVVTPFENWNTPTANEKRVMTTPTPIQLPFVKWGQFSSGRWEKAYAVAATELAEFVTDNKLVDTPPIPWWRIVEGGLWGARLDKPVTTLSTSFGW